jgi:hypothetical protein
MTTEAELIEAEFFCAPRSIVMTPRQFVRAAQERAGEILAVRIVPPRIGKDFGRLCVVYKTRR